MKPFVTLLLVFLGSIGFAQLPNGQNQLKCRGTIPDDFLTLSSVKYADQVKTEVSGTSKKDRKAQEEFLLKSNFRTDALLKSGRVLFNDEVSNYVNRIADNILRDQPELREQLKFYVVRSPVVNASATNNGFVFIHMGLLSRLENEAQLAFVLCHEIQHFVKKHPINRYVESANIGRKKGTYGHLSYNDKILAQSNYSKEQELEADLLGFQLMKNTGYDLNEIEGLFDILLLSDQPAVGKDFDKTFFDTPYLQFPDSFFNDVEAYEKPEDYDDSESTHPNIAKRREQINSARPANNNSEGQKFIIGEETFARVLRLVNYDLCDHFLRDRQYQQTIYHAWNLLQDEPENTYLKKTIAKAMFGFIQYFYSTEGKGVVVRPNEVFGPAQQVFHAVYKLGIAQSLAHSTLFIRDLHRACPEDRDLEKMYQKLITKIALEQPDFINQAIEKYESQIKYDNPKKNFVKQAFSDQMGDTEFRERIEKEIERQRDESAVKLTRRERKKRKNLKKWAKMKGLPFGADKILIFEPQFLKIDQTGKKKDPILYQEGEEGQERIVKLMKLAAEAADLNYEFLRIGDLAPEDTEKFNDISGFQVTLAEILDHGFELDYIPVNQDQLDLLADKYGSDYLAWFGMTSIKSSTLRRKMLGAVMVPTIWGTIPGLYMLLKPKLDTYLFTVIVDARLGKVVYSKIDHMRASARGDLIRSLLYDTMLQIKTPPKK